MSNPTPLPQEFQVFTADEPNSIIHGFTAEDMQAHELAGYKRGVEDAAKVCDDVDKQSQSQWPQRLATMIRKLGKQEVGFNGLTEAETKATASVAGLAKVPTHLRKNYNDWRTP